MRRGEMPHDFTPASRWMLKTIVTRREAGCAMREEDMTLGIRVPRSGMSKLPASLLARAGKKVRRRGTRGAGIARRRFAPWPSDMPVLKSHLAARSKQSLDTGSTRWKERQWGAESVNPAPMIMKGGYGKTGAKGITRGAGGCEGEGGEGRERKARPSWRPRLGHLLARPRPTLS